MNSPSLQNPVAHVTPEAKQHVVLSRRGRALMGGTLSMIEAGTEFLPKFQSETNEYYRARLTSSWLFNGFRKTVEDMCGRIFDHPVVMTTEGSAKDWVNNVDMEGQTLGSFASQVFSTALSGSGISYILVDAPTRSGTVTQEQAQRQQLRPYFVHIPPEQVLGWDSETEGANTRLTRFRFYQYVKEPDPNNKFQNRSVLQISYLSLENGQVVKRTYKQKDRMALNGAAPSPGDFVKNQVSLIGEWRQEEEIPLVGVSEITVVPVYLKRSGFMRGEPILDSLADVVIAHWQSQSDQRNILHHARTPMLFGAGFEQDEPIVVSAGKALTVADSSATLKWVEHSGMAIGAGRQDLKDLEFQMEALGLPLLVARSGRQSATGEIIDASKEMSGLSMMADSTESALNKAYEFASVYSGDTSEVKISLNKDFTVAPIGDQELSGLLNMVSGGLLSRSTFLKEMVRRGVLSPEIDPTEEIARIDSEEPTVTGTGLDLNRSNDG